MKKCEKNEFKVVFFRIIGYIIYMKICDDENFMREAIRLAKKAYRKEETPIGCVIVHDGRIIGRGYNRRDRQKRVLAHAEIFAIEQASKRLGDWRLEDCTLYVTLEPCPMCAGAIVQARIPRVVLGARNPKAGCAGSVLNLFDVAGFNHQVSLTDGICEEECRMLMSGFFRELREKNKKSDKRK